MISFLIVVLILGITVVIVAHRCGDVGAYPDSEYSEYIGENSH